MIEVIRTIEKEHKELHPFKTVFKDTRFKRIWIYPSYVIFGVLGIGFLFLPKSINQNVWWSVAYIIGLFMLLFAFFYFKVNKFAKRQLKLKGIKTDPSFFKHWASIEYCQNKSVVFYNKLLELGLVLGHKEKDIILLKEYSDFFEKKATKQSKVDYVKIFGGLILLFLVPIWNQLLGFLYSKTPTEELIKTIKLTGIMYVYIILLGYLILFLRHGLESFLEIRLKEYKQITYELLNIKWNIVLNNESQQ